MTTLHLFLLLKNIQNSRDSVVKKSGLSLVENKTEVILINKNLLTETTVKMQNA